VTSEAALPGQIVKSRLRTDQPRCAVDDRVECSVLFIESWNGYLVDVKKAYVMLVVTLDRIK
jgi:hypothetical protein